MHHRLAGIAPERVVAGADLLDDLGPAPARRAVPGTILGAGLLDRRRLGLGQELTVPQRLGTLQGSQRVIAPDPAERSGWPWAVLGAR